MKKTLIIFALLLTLSGCSNKKEDKFANFEHYNLKGKDIVIYNYIDDNGINNIYAVSDITPENSEMKINGLFYNINDNEYILLDNIESGDSIQSSIYSYDNKLYVNACNSACHWEYTLNQEKFSKKQLKFDTSQIANRVDLYNILSIKDRNIYWYARDYGSENGYANWGKDLKLKCSLDSYKCELFEE